MALFGTSVSLAGAADDLQRLSWTLRRKPLESLLAPQAAVPLEGGGGVLVCHDGSLVSLIVLDGARSMMGSDELDRFVDVAALRLSTAFSHPGHALHVTFERAPDEAHTLAAGHREAVSRQAGRLGLDLEDLLAERARRLTPLIAAETLVVACWTRPSVLPRDRWSATGRAAQEAQGLAAGRGRGAVPPPRAGRAMGAPRGAARRALRRAGRDRDRGPEADGGRGAPPHAPHGQRRGVHGAGLATVTAANDAPMRVTEPTEAGAFPPPLAPQLLVREPERTGGGIRIGERLYGALDMSLGPRHARPFGELMAGLAAAGLRREGLRPRVFPAASRS